jgi:signal transduction histidine kinase
MPRRHPPRRKSTRTPSRKARPGRQSRTAQKELRKPRLQVAELERLAAIGQLAIIVARQMWNPLTSLALSIDVLARRAENPENLAKLSQTDGERKRISNLLKDFVEFAELRPPRMEAIDLREVVQSAVGVTRPFLKPHAGLRVTVGTASARVHGDVVQTHKAISSVIHRAFDVTEVGLVTVGLQRERDGWAVVVRDSGPRLLADERLQLFEPRFGGRTVRDRIALELYFGKIMVMGHGGDIEVDSTRSGTAFTVWLPSSHRGTVGRQNEKSERHERAGGHGG